MRDREFKEYMGLTKEHETNETHETALNDSRNCIGVRGRQQAITPYSRLLRGDGGRRMIYLRQPIATFAAL